MDQVLKRCRGLDKAAIEPHFTQVEPGESCELAQNVVDVVCTECTAQEADNCCAATQAESVQQDAEAPCKLAL